MLPNNWDLFCKREFAKPYFQQLSVFLHNAYETKQVYPPKRLVFYALQQTPPEKVRVVILGQDPYHQPGQAMGLAFSVSRGVPLPPSLRNIFTELKNDLGIQNTSGDLTHWARQGVLLLNTVMSVEEGKPGSHRNKGWEQFTDAVIAHVNEQDQPLVFVLWGADARKKQSMIASRHLIISAPHPSPLSAHRGFFGSRPFSKINAYLVQNGSSEIDWRTK